MAWYHLPVVDAGPSSVNNTDVGEWKFVNELTQAVLERAWLAGACFWPPAGYRYESGTVPNTGVSETQFTDPSKSGIWKGGTDDVSGLSYPFPWIGSTFADNQLPTFWKVVFDHNDASKVVIADVVSWTNTGTLVYTNCRDYQVMGITGSTAFSGDNPVTMAGLIPGRKYYIIAGGGRGTWWSQRVLEWPNDRMLAVGNVRILPQETDQFFAILPASPTTSLIRDKTQHWKSNEHVGRQMMVYGNDGHLHRVDIVSNTATVINFATKAWTAVIDGPYCIILNQRRAIPGRNDCHPFAWYRGSREQFRSHNPGDVGGDSALMPAQYVKIPRFDGSMCIDDLVPIFDVDFWTSNGSGDFHVDQDSHDICGLQPERSSAFDLFKTIRGLQVALENFSAGFVENKNWDGADSILLLNPAEMFKLANINFFTLTTGNVAGGGANNTIAITGGARPPYFPIQVWYSLHVPAWIDTFVGPNIYHPSSYKWSRGYMLDANTLVDESDPSAFLQFDVTSSYPGDNAQTVIVSPGWTRFPAREFKRMFDIDGLFDPDTHDVGGTDTAYDPAVVADFAGSACFGVGSFQKRGKSTKYLKRKDDTLSWQTPQGFALEGDDNFTVGDIARYVGDNFFDPAVADGVPTSGTGHFFNTSSAGATANYWERAYVGQHSHPVQVKREAARYGKADQDGGNTYLRDKNQTWFDHQWFAGPMRTESGTATGGSTTTMSDTGKASGAANCFWSLPRFLGANPYLSFTIEVLFGTTDWDDATHAIIEKRLITASSSTTVSVTWIEPLITGSASGRPYRIKEPYLLNRYKGRQVLIEQEAIIANVATLQRNTVTITGNCEDWLFFADPGFKIVKGARFMIIDPPVGTIWKWDGAKWIKPTGTDVHRLGVGTARNFRNNQLENLPYYLKRYGRFTYGDAVGSETFNEIYKVCNILTAVKKDASWVAPLDPLTLIFEAEGTSGKVPFIDPATCVRSDVNAYDAAKALWGTNPQNTGASICNGSAPFACSNVHFTKFTGPAPHPCAFDDGCSNAALQRQLGFLEVTGMCVREAYSVAFYAKALNCNCGLTDSINVFDSNGDPVLYNAWKSFGGAGPAIQERARAQLGSLGLPNGSFPDGVSVFDANRGYAVVDQCVIVKGNVSGGFTYYASGASPLAEAAFWLQEMIGA